jgi:uncharacterized membrane protein
VEWSLFLPLLLGAILFGVVSVAAGVMSGRGNEEGAERVRDYAFLLLIAMGAWTVVLTLLAIFDEPDEIWDMVTIGLVIAVFFVLLLLAFWGISLLIGMIGRGTTRRRRVTTEDL